MYFELKEEPKDISLTILDDNNNVVRKYTKDDMRLKFVKANGTSFNNGLSKFAWDMRYDVVEFFNLQPIASPGQYKAKLSVDGVEQVSQFELSISPNESYSKAQLREKKEFWMDLYNTGITSSEQLKKALATQEQVMAKAKAQTALLPRAEAVSGVVDGYKATYIPKGRTLAEIINQPSKIFSKMAWLHNMMESSEGPATQSMIDQLADLKAQMSAADAAFEKDMKAAMEAFEQAS